MQIGMEPLVIDWAKEEPKMGQIIRLIIKFPIELEKYRNRTAKISADITVLLFKVI